MMAKNNARSVGKLTRANVKQDEPKYTTIKSMLLYFAKTVAGLFGLWLFMWLCYFAFAPMAV